MDKILTIVIPTYNMEKYLRKCLDSLIVEDKHVFDTLEVLVVNDGSKDTSSAIAHEYQNKYPNVFHVIDKENGNYGSCVNRGLNEAQGKYIKILDADDSFINSTFNDYMIFLTGTESDMVFNDFELVDENGKVIRRIAYKFPTDRTFSFADIPYSKMNGIVMHGVAFRTQNLRGIDYHQTEGISYTDMEWVFMPCSTARTISYFSGSLYQYLYGREGQTIDASVRVKRMSHENRVLESMVISYNRMKEKIQNNSAQKYLNQRLCERLKNLYLSYLTNDKVSSEGLREFDNFLEKESPEYYQKSNDFVISSIFPFRYIKWWRKNRDENSLPTYVNAMQYVNSKCLSFSKRLTEKL